MISTLRPAPRRSPTSCQNFRYVSHSIRRTARQATAGPGRPVAPGAGSAWPESRRIAGRRRLSRTAQNPECCRGSAATACSSCGGHPVRVPEQLDVFVTGEPFIHLRLLRAAAKPLAAVDDAGVRSQRTDEDLHQTWLCPTRSPRPGPPLHRDTMPRPRRVRRTECGATATPHAGTTFQRATRRAPRS